MLKVVSKTWLLALLLALAAIPAKAARSAGDDVFSAIDAAASSGRLTLETALLYKVYAVRAPELLPSEFRVSLRPVKCGTPVMMEAFRAAPGLSQSFRAALEAMTGRPPTDSTYQSPRGWFLIHYDLDSSNAVSSTDADSSGHPDFIEKLAVYFDSSWSHEVGTLGWRRPPSDGVAGGDSLYDIYPTSIGLTYGFTIQEAPGPEPWSDYSSYILVNKSFVGFPPNDDVEGQQAGSMKVTAAHEFNHACQFADNPLHIKVTESWWQEISATWIEDVVYDNVNDNYNYLSDFFPVPEISLFDGGVHKYGAFVLDKYIQENYGPGLVRDVWETMRWSDANSAIDTALMTQSSNFAATFETFAGWNYFTDSRDDGVHYEEGARYLAVPITRVETTYPIVSRNGASIQSMAADYIEFLPDGSGRDVVELDINGSGGADWRAALWLIDSSATAEERTISIDSSTGEGTIFLGGFNTLDRAVLVVTNTSFPMTQSTYQYSFHFLPRADCDNDGDADVFDLLYLIDFVYNQGPVPVPFWQVGDLNCSGGIDILDISILLDYALKGGPEPCPPLN